MGETEVPVSFYIHLAPDNSNHDRPLSNEEFLAQMTDMELEQMYEMEPSCELTEQDEIWKISTSHHVGEELPLLLSKEPVRQDFVRRATWVEGRRWKTRLPEKHSKNYVIVMGQPERPKFYPKPVLTTDGRVIVKLRPMTPRMALQVPPPIEDFSEGIQIHVRDTATESQYVLSNPRPLTVTIREALAEKLLSRYINDFEARLRDAFSPTKR